MQITTSIHGRIPQGIEPKKEFHAGEESGLRRAFVFDWPQSVHSACDVLGERMASSPIEKYVDVTFGHLFIVAITDDNGG